MRQPALARLVQAMELVPLKQAHLLHLQGAPLTYVYFPLSGLISVVMPSNGKSVETGIVGAEGFFGVPLLFGVDHCPMAAITQMDGHAMRAPAEVFRDHLRRDAPLASALNRYGYAFMVMVAQGAVCNGAHSVEQRCARWLLAAHDRVEGGELPLTQAYLAQMLGVRRPSVSEVAEKLQRRRLIKYGQGRITILDRRGLEGMSCICYSIIRGEFERVQLM